MKQLFHASTMSALKNRRHTFCLIVFAIISLTGMNISCKKILAINPPTDSITTTQVFSTDDLATSAMMGVYHQMINANGDNFANGAITIYSGASADEFNFYLTTITDNAQIQFNTLTATNSKILSSFWSNGFSILYAANAVLEGVTNSESINDSVKNELKGQAKFIRAFCNFYLCNLFGDIPLITETNWHNTSLLSRTPIDEVYQQIISDLKDAQSLLPPDYAVGNGERIIPNKWAAKALLARVYLYLEDWTNAETLSGEIISNVNLFSINIDLNDVFKMNSRETIWQLQQSNIVYPYNATNEGYKIIPADATSQPLIYITDYLINDMGDNDKRKADWIDSTFVDGSKYYYPYKYKVGPSESTPNGAYTEYYMVLRLAEQILIRAEAGARQNKLSNAISDINLIRQRAGLPLLPATLTQEEIISNIERERKVELFAEWGHRWLDLKRWKKADIVLAPIKGSNWQSSDTLYPIPLSELQTDPNLTQNPGY
jgi:hypothetical protein